MANKWRINGENKEESNNPSFVFLVSFDSLRLTNDKRDVTLVKK